MSRGGATQLLVVVDAFSKYLKLHALKRATTQIILNKMNKYFAEVQKPRCVLSDNGTQFTSRQWRARLLEQGVQTKFTSVYFPEGNITERYNKEIGRVLRAYCHERHSKWATLLDFVQDCLNQAINESTGFSPIYLQYGKNIEHPIERYISFPEYEGVGLSRERVLIMAKQNLMVKAEKRKFREEQKIKPASLAVGDKVLVRTHYQSSMADKTIKKFFLLFEGPYTVSRQVGPNSYIVRDDGGKELSKQNVINLRPYRQFPKKQHL
nr:unnamed protein product [Callosobruchus analis]